MDLNDYRKEIDQIDDELIALFAKRMETAEKIAAYKQANGLRVLDARHEKEKMRTLMEKTPEDLREYVSSLYSLIFELSRRRQSCLLGARGDLPAKIAEAIGLTKWVTEAPIVKTLLDAGYPDRIYCVSDEEARAMANRLCQEEGIFCGMSSGANVAVALRIAKELGPGKNVVTTIVDRRDRYLSETPYEKYVV